jgi:hypothetical protein
VTSVYENEKTQLEMEMCDNSVTSEEWKKQARREEEEGCEEEGNPTQVGLREK